jgi:hypothetical protein
MENRAANFKIANAASSLKTFFSENTWTIFDSKLCLESALHWLSTLFKTFFSKLPFSCRKKRIKSNLTEKWAADFKIANAASSLNTFFSESTWTIFDSKICLESVWHWLSILLKAFLLKLPFLSHKKRPKSNYFNPLSHGSFRNSHYTAWRPIGPLLSRPAREKRGEVDCRLLPCRYESSGNFHSVARFRLYFKKSNFIFTSSSVPGCFYCFL